MLHQQIYDEALETGLKIGLKIRPPLHQLRLSKVHVCGCLN